MLPQTSVKSYIVKKKRSDPSFSHFITTLENNAVLALVGGGIRDILLSKKPRDLDFIYWGTLTPVIEQLCLNTTRNRFGGYKILFKDFEVDIWSAEDNWAFRNNYFTPEVENVHHGCFFNYDSLVCALNKNYFECSYYLQFLNSNMLDFVIKNESYIWENPFPALNIVRAIQIKCKHNSSFSTHVDEYISKFVKQNKSKTYSLLQQAEFNHFKKSTVKTEYYLEIINRYL
jgi:hypothetical protein